MGSTTQAATSSRRCEAVILAKRPIIGKLDDYPLAAKSFLASDIEGLQALTDAGRMIWTDEQTKVRVLQREEHAEPTMIEVRVLEGCYRGTVGYCLDGSVFHLVSARQASISRANRKRLTGMERSFFETHLSQIRSCLGRFQQIVPRMDLKAPKPKTVAERLVNAARDCEKEGDAAGSAELYRLVVREYPASPQAAEAAARLRGRP